MTVTPSPSERTARGRPVTKGPRRITVDIGELGWAREDYDPDHLYYLDLDTGEVLPERGGEEMGGPDVQVPIEPGPRYLAVPSPEPGEGYQDMMDFIGTVSDAMLKAMLSVAIQGAGAFRRFKDVLLEFPKERERWFAFKDTRTRERLEAWLAGECVEVDWTGIP